MSQTVHNTLQLQIDQLTREILNATEKAWEAQKKKDWTRNTFWIEEKKKLTAERTTLQQQFHQTPSQQDSIKPTTHQEIKQQIRHLNHKALEADQHMRSALENKQLSQANTFLRQRNQFNAEVKHLSELLPSNNDDPVSDSTQKTTDKSPSREDIERKINDYNEKALRAGQQMRTALNERKLEKANELLQQRNYLNAEVKKLTELLKPATEPSTTPHTAQLSDNNPPAATQDPDTLRRMIKDYSAKALLADRKMRDALGEKDLEKAHHFLQQRNSFNGEAKRLLEVLKATLQEKLIVTNNNNKSEPDVPILNRAELKRKILELNKAALQADASIHAALQEKHYEKANEFLNERNLFNAEAKRLSQLLSAELATSSQQVLASPNQEIIEENEEEQAPVAFATCTAQKYIDYRLAFVKHFHQKRELEAKIASEQSVSCNVLSEELLGLQNALQEHCATAPLPYIEDHIHNDIVLHLLAQTDENGVARFNFPEISDTSIGAPLQQLRNHNDLECFISSCTEEGLDIINGKRVLTRHFIRDIIQIRCSMTISDFIFHDAIMDTAEVENGFVACFDSLINEVNDEITRLHGESDDPQIPTILRSISHFGGLAHRDAIQLIPPAQDGIDQFSGSILADTTIQDNIIYSSAKLQGIFSTDGAFDNLQIINNKIRTEGEHKISILGMLSGKVIDNTDLHGNEIDIRIQPLRLGGGAAITNFFILGFAPDCSYQYEFIEGISDTPLDRRSKKVVLGAYYDPRKYYLNFDMDLFIEYYKLHDKACGRFEAIKEIIEQMEAEGDAVKCNEKALEALENGATQQEAVEIALAPFSEVIEGIGECLVPQEQKKPS